MANLYSQEPMIEMYVFETSQLIEQLETAILLSEKYSSFSIETINEIFRIMHTIKGSSGMMMFTNISTLTHALEDLFLLMREEKATHIDYGGLSDLVLESVDFIKVELEKIKNGDEVDGKSDMIITEINHLLKAARGDNASLPLEKKGAANEAPKFYISQSKKPSPEYKNTFKAVIYFEDDCEMENFRAYTVINNLKDITEAYEYFPPDIIDNDDTIQVIKEEGFTILLKSDKSYQEIHTFLSQTVFLKELELTELLEEDKSFQSLKRTPGTEGIEKPEDLRGNIATERELRDGNNHQSIISVSVGKLDKLMDLVGEMVIAEAMVTQNPDLKGLTLENFYKSAGQLKKITSELQDMVMSIRMLPLHNTFHKMHRIVRDMSKKLGKEVELEINGEATEVDKNIIEYISDPLMHLVRNAIDHGIETPKERLEKGKSGVGTLKLQAKNAGSDVIITLADDGKGLDKDKILQRAEENGLMHKPVEEMTDREIYSLIFLPGFSTKEKVTEFSGRGVGMDVVMKNVEMVGGSVAVESNLNVGTTINLKIPLTLAIIDGMNIKVGGSSYTIPITSIKESFRAKKENILTDPDGNELIMLRGQCYPILRLHQVFKVRSAVEHIAEGIVIVVTDGEKTICIFADELVGQQQVVVKTLPTYIKNLRKIKGLAGCTLLGDGSISLIVDVSGLINI